jgi:hypothetical protein
MLPVPSRTWKAVASGLVCTGLLVCPSSARGQPRPFMSGGRGSSTSRIASPTVVASWRERDSYADGSTTALLVLWRGTPGWFTAGGRGTSSGSSGGSGSAGSRSAFSYSYDYMTYGGRTFTMEFDDNRKIVKLLNQEISLKDTNVVLIDFVDSPGGPTIVGYRWLEPGPPAPPLVEGAVADPIAGVIMRSPELYEYLRCDVKVADPLMNAMMPMICGLMRGERILPPGVTPR